MSELRLIADLMAVAARTAPKTKGEDFVVTRIVEGEELKQLAEGMLAFGQRTGKKNFDRDARNVLASDSLVLIGIKDATTAGLNCGACGHACSDCRAGRCCFPSLGCCERGVVLCAFTDGYACCAPRSDPSHCGSCGRACATGQTCIDSACR